MTLYEALAAAGFVAVANELGNYSREIVSLSTGMVVGDMTANQCWEWLASLEVEQ